MGIEDCADGNPLGNMFLWVYWDFMKGDATLNLQLLLQISRLQLLLMQFWVTKDEAWETGWRRSLLKSLENTRKWMKHSFRICVQSDTQGGESEILLLEHPAECDEHSVTVSTQDSALKGGFWASSSGHHVTQWTLWWLTYLTRLDMHI